MEGADEGAFDAAKAELFEAIGHPYRIRIIQALDQGPLGFAELKKKVGMESSGHLSFHLGKLQHLVTMNTDGRYALTGEGREALRMIQTVKEKDGRVHRPVIEVRRTLIAVLLVLTVALAAVAAVQQMEIAGRPLHPGTIVLNGKPFWYAVIPLTSLPAKGNFTVTFEGIEFTLVPSRSPGLTVQVTASPGGSATLVGPNVSSVYKGVPSGIPVTVILSLPYGAVVKFADGTVEAMPNLTGTNPAGSSVQYFFVSGVPWFSAHTSPQAAVSENMTSVTLYVSV